MKTIDCQVKVAFYYNEEELLKDNNKSYCTMTGSVAVYRSIKTAYAPAVYNDLEAFISCNELHLTKGEHKLQINADLIYENGDMIQHLGYEKLRH